MHLVPTSYYLELYIIIYETEEVKSSQWKSECVEYDSQPISAEFCLWSQTWPQALFHTQDKI